MGRRFRRAALAASLAAGMLLLACGNGQSRVVATTPPPTTALPGSPPVVPTPIASDLTHTLCDGSQKVAYPDWIPADLPLPHGTYAYKNVPQNTSFHSIILIVPIPLLDLARFVLREWPKQGWLLGRGDSEAGEIEDSFTKAPALGAFKAQVTACSSPRSVMLLLFAPTGVAGVPSGGQGGSPLLPSPSPTAS